MHLRGELVQSFTQDGQVSSCRSPRRLTSWHPVERSDPAERYTPDSSITEDGPTIGLHGALERSLQGGCTTHMYDQERLELCTSTALSPTSGRDATACEGGDGLGWWLCAARRRTCHFSASCGLFAPSLQMQRRQMGCLSTPATAEPAAVLRRQRART